LRHIECGIIEFYVISIDKCMQGKFLNNKVGNNLAGTRLALNMCITANSVLVELIAYA